MSTIENRAAEVDVGTQCADVEDFRSPLARSSMTWNDIDQERRRTLSGSSTDSSRQETTCEDNGVEKVPKFAILDASGSPTTPTCADEDEASPATPNATTDRKQDAMFTLQASHGVNTDDTTPMPSPQKNGGLAAASDSSATTNGQGVLILESSRLMFLVGPLSRACRGDAPHLRSCMFPVRVSFPSLSCTVDVERWAKLDGRMFMFSHFRAGISPFS
eukprot:m.562643 g.562643  ORF g.562643 m.562643 type:complete len:218 (+) comp22223_c1_seq8:292-945(+)